MSTTDPVHAIAWGPLLVALFGGLAIFLLGMEQITDAMRSEAGGGVRRLLGRLTTNRFRAAVAGTMVTAVTQSSSITTVLVVGFVSAGLMTLTQSVGVIMGANIGSTVTAQIIAFRITRAALLLIAVGFTVRFATHHERLRRYAALVMGLGLIFFGMNLMSEATLPLRSYAAFLDVLQTMDRPLLGILVGALFTALVQSSAATIAIVIALASAGLMTLEAGIALTLGANIGTCVTAWLAALGKPRTALRTAAVHILFNVLGVVLWLFFIDQLAAVVRWISPAATELDDATRLAAETPRQIANAHTIFNVVNTAIFIGFTGRFAHLVQLMVPDRPGDDGEPVRPLYLDRVFLDSPALALDRVHLELGRLAGLTMRMVREAPPAVIVGTRDELRAIYRMDDDVDSLHGAIIGFLGQLARRNLTDGESRRLYDCLAIANYMENIGDTIETNLVTLGLERAELGVEVSRAARDGLRPLYDAVVQNVERAFAAHAAGDVELAAEVLASKERINRLAETARDALSGWRIADDARRLAAFRFETDVIENLKRLYYFAKRIAKLVPETGAAGLPSAAAPIRSVAADDAGEPQDSGGQPS